MGDEPEVRGLLVHGFGIEHANCLKDFAAALTGYAIEMIDASGSEDHSLEYILGSGGSNAFLDSETKVLMFLSFTDEELSNFMDSYPGELPRPIFCCLTAENVNWKLKDLISDLLEEDRYWKEKQIGDPHDQVDRKCS